MSDHARDGQARRWSTRDREFVKPTGVEPQYTVHRERIPPVARPYKRNGCVWVHGSGWVWNPSRRKINHGEERH